MSWLEYEHFCGFKGWEESVFDSARKIIKEEENFIKNPIKFEEGTPCKKCNSTNTYSHQKQTRSADEGFTTFTSCFVCKYSWREN